MPSNGTGRLRVGGSEAAAEVLVDCCCVPRIHRALVLLTSANPKWVVDSRGKHLLSPPAG
jgi:hypothetical protein